MFSGQGKVPWHGEGTIVQGLLNAKDAIHAAGLDWNAVKSPCFLSMPDGSFADASPDHYFVKRDDVAGIPGILGHVGKQYLPLQNRDAFAFFDSVVGAKAAVYDTAGALGNGQRIWVLAKLPDSIRIGKDDLVEEYLLLSNSHDGTSSVTAALTNVRVVCQNTLSMAVGGASKIIKVRHTKSMDAGLQEGLRILGLVKEQAKKVEGIFGKMASIQVDTAMLAYFLEYVVPSASSTGNSTRAINVRDTIKELFEGKAKGADLPEFKGTAWGLYNSVVEYVDYYRAIGKSSSRLENIWFGSGATIKEKAFDLCAKLDTVNVNQPVAVAVP
jgi:phage/plasmid-like protein (TIGR03299 family)